MSFHLVIISPKGVYLDDNVDSLSVKLTSGYRTILSGHTPLIGALDYAPMHTLKNNVTTYYSLNGGALNVTKDKVVLIVNSIESKDEIDILRAENAKKRAMDRLQSKDPNIDIKRAEAALYRAISRIKTYEIH